MNTLADDRFVIYYTEKLWEMIPAIYKHEDGLAENPHVLRSFIALIAEQAAILRRSQDRLWEDQFIELCNDWSIPYIGDLVGTRLLSAQLRRGQRIDVAKTIYYRRRKGTPRILEELINDISGWDGKLVEGFKRLARARHGLDAKPELFAGPFTGTMPGGWADLRSGFGSEIRNGPFEEYFHLPDMRKPRGVDGRYGINRLNFHLFRLISFEVKDVQPFSMGDGQRFLFDPSGRNIPLFNKRHRHEGEAWEEWHSAFEWELPLPIRCRLLGHAAYKIDAGHVQYLFNQGLLTQVEADELMTVIGHQFKSESQLQLFLSTLVNGGQFVSAPVFNAILNLTIIPASGKNQLIPSSVSVETGNPLVRIPKELIVAAALPDPNWQTIALSKDLAIDAEQGRFRSLNGLVFNLVSASYCYGFSGPVGAGTYERRNVEDSEPTILINPGPGVIGAAVMLPIEIVQIGDNKTYRIQSNHATIIEFTLQSANQTRPYLILENDWILSTQPNADATLVLDGLWIGNESGNQFNIILRGDFELVTIRNCTFDPGGDQDATGQPILPVSLIIDGSVEKLCIEASILGPIHTANNGLIGDEVCISNSIIQSVSQAVHAVNLANGTIHINRSTVFGRLNVHRLYASEVLITDIAQVTDTQTGCFRFSAAPAPPMSRLPRPYESFLFFMDNNHWFGSRRFGQPDFAQLSDTAPVELYRGGENGAEIGVFNSLLNSIKLDGLKSKVDEYMPFGLIPSFINET